MGVTERCGGGRRAGERARTRTPVGRRFVIAAASLAAILPRDAAKPALHKRIDMKRARAGKPLVLLPLYPGKSLPPTRLFLHQPLPRDLALPHHPLHKHPHRHSALAASPSPAAHPFKPPHPQHLTGSPGPRTCCPPRCSPLHTPPRRCNAHPAHQKFRNTSFQGSSIV